MAKKRRMFPRLFPHEIGVTTLDERNRGVVVIKRFFKVLWVELGLFGAVGLFPHGNQQGSRVWRFWRLYMVP